jgi:heme/copper-type cytochrome/quinol oxidase subunit 2
MVFNSTEVVMMYLADSIAPNVLANETASHDEIMMAIAVYMVIALISTALAGCVLVLIAKNENREKMLAVSVKGNIKGQARLVSVPLVISVIICAAYMCLSELIM